ncbi:molecular chaperone TorD family protein [Desulfitobacterium sp.]|uniref:TorD/DmsD family molecular chaperone n=1 Tax=Desulfitobacterium sp. TaxID=49981 RepID=UPI002CBE2F4B|nr:molecular chaperone TorD family protein [Desulfitobacterium sp.]HVJ47608.1 molecular chaperone TorD family protein [Desulfitobacterium sp.]
MEHTDILQTASEEIQNEMSRAVLYNLFASLIARKTDETWLNPYFQNQLQIGLPQSEGKTELLSDLEKALKSPGYHQEIQLDYDRLFIVPGPSQTFPYESCYTHRNIDGTFGRLWQEPAQDMQRILKEWDIQFAEGWDLLPDHIAVELFFMAELCQRRSQAQSLDQKTLREWQVNFFQTHLQPWVFEFIERVEKEAETGFYHGGATLLREFLTEEEEELSK